MGFYEPINQFRLPYLNKSHNIHFMNTSILFSQKNIFPGKSGNLEVVVCLYDRCRILQNISMAEWEYCLYFKNYPTHLYVMIHEVLTFAGTKDTAISVTFWTLWGLSVFVFFFRSMLGMKQILQNRSPFSSFSLRFSWNQKLLALNICS
jgi:hypothetical protein